MEILVLVKPVPDPETRLRPNAAGTDLDADGVKWVLAGYDESAVEQALLLKESMAGSSVRAVSLGPAPRTEEVLRATLALGCDAATWAEQDPSVRLDPLATARGLAVVLQRYHPDLVLVGKQAGDDESGIVGPAVGEALGVPDFGPAVEVRWDATASRFTFQVSVEGGVEVVRAPVPLVLELQQAWNDPRTARLPNILKSRRMTIDKVPWTDIQPTATQPSPVLPTSFQLPAPRTGANMIQYKTPEEAAQKLVRLLVEESKVLP
ncbi:MAG: electron transfer flavoprotein subunit beta/FixA family protein [Thermoplasmata archaeon]